MSSITTRRRRPALPRKRGRPAGRSSDDGVIADRETLLAAAERLIRKRGPGVPLGAIAIEAGVTDYWRKYVGLEGAVIGIDTFGESAPAGVLYRHFGITADALVAAVKSL